MRILSVILVFSLAPYLLAVEFSVEKIHEYASHVRVSPEAKDYIDALAPETITEIVDQLNFDRDGRGQNTFFFSFSCRKAAQLQQQNVPFDEDYVFSKLTDFVRSALKKGDVGIGGGAMNSLKRFDHPTIIELAKELKESENELTRDNALKLLEHSEKRKKERSRMLENVNLFKMRAAENHERLVDSKTKEKKSNLPSVIAGILVIVIVVLLLKAFKGQFTH